MRTWIALLMVVGLALAGCSGGGNEKGDEAGDGSQKLKVTDSTGGIRGVVVDAAITPVLGVFVTLAGGQNMTTGDDGLFNFTGLAPGDYFIQAGKPGFTPATAATTVVAGVADPPVVKILIQRLATTGPYLDTFRLDGFYECGFAMSFITDGCDFVYRTAYDEVNPPIVPRTVQKNVNTQYIFVPADTYAIVQEGFWDMDATPEFMVMVDETPIHNDCDCSNTYQAIKGTSPLLSRLDRFAADGSLNTEFRDDLGWNDLLGEMPSDDLVAARGFLPPPSDDPIIYAINMQFTVLTTLFHNYQPDPAWTFETREQFPVG